MDESPQIRRNIVVFLDTMIYLHFKPFDEVDWRGVLKSDQVTIILLPIIVSELDKHKDTHPNQKLRKRAKSISKKFNDLFENDLEVALRNGVAPQLIVVEQDFE